MPQERVRVAEFDSRIEAELARSKLETNGISAHLQADDVGGAYPVLEKDGVSVWVVEAHFQEAQQILSGPPSDDGDSSGDLHAAEDAVRGHVPAGGFASRAGPALFFVLVAVAAAYLIGRNQSPASWSYAPAEAGVEEGDRNGDGKADAWYEYRGDSWTSSRLDRNFDGRPDEWHKLEDGEPVESEYDNDFDGDPDLWTEYSLGNPTRSTFDLDDDGTIDASVVYDRGLPAVYELRPNGGRLEQVELYEHGRLREVYSVSETGDRALIRRYDAFGREITEVD